MKRIFFFLIALCLIAGCQNDMGTSMQKDSQTATTTASPQAQVSPAAAAAGLNAAFSMSPKKGGDVDTNFKFNAAASTGSITKFSWNFGDGSTDTGKAANHKFKTNGTFTVKLTVSGNGGAKDTLNKHLDVAKAGGGGGGGGKCTNPAPNNGFIFGTVVGVQGLNAIVKLPAGSTCANSFYNCGDMRRANPEQFRGIIHGMSDLGNNTFSIFNDCPFRWPPAIGERVFLYWKTCAANHCP